MSSTGEQVQGSVFRWADLEAAAPEVAAQGRERIEHFRYLLAGTIRRDGTPRISPVEAHCVDGYLMLVMMAGTHKVRDLKCDPRITLNAPVTDAADPGFEFKLRGRVAAIEDAELKQRVAAAIETKSGWRPPQHWHFLTIDIEEAAIIAWRENEMLMTRWTRDGGLDHAQKRIVLDELGG